MFMVTRFCVVPWERRGGRLVRGEFRVFHTPGAARPVVDRLRRKYERVDLYQVTGWPAQDLWDRPRRID